MFKRSIFYRNAYLGINFIPFYTPRDRFDEIENYKPPPPPQNGWDRIKLLFHEDNKGYVSKEYISCIHYTTGGFILGFLLGGLNKSIASYSRFIQENQATKFISVYEARRKLSDKSVVEFVNGGCLIGLKYGFANFLFSFTSMIVAAYRDKKGIIEYVIGGVVAGSFMRMYLGFKACLAAGAIGGVMGGMIGVIFYVGSLMTGTTVNDLHQWQYDLKVQSDDNRRKFMKRAGHNTNVIQHWEAHEGLRGAIDYNLDEKDFAYVKVDKSELYPIDIPQKPKSALDDIPDYENLNPLAQ